jgi:ankyrin repeat protein
MYHNGGLWEISECQLEAALGLWYWSVGQLPGIRRSVQRKIFMVERAEKRRALTSAIRLWVTPTYHISTLDVKLPSSMDTSSAMAAAPLNGIPHVILDGSDTLSHYPTTLSVPLMTLFDSDLTRQDEGSQTPVRGAEALDGICLSIATQSSLLQLVAQDIFGIFISRVADVLEPLAVAEPRIRRGEMQVLDLELGDTAANRSFIGLTNRHVGALADAFVSSGIGSREDALMTMIPPLLQRAKLPDTDEVMETLIGTAKKLRRDGKFTQAEGLLRWLIGNVPRRFQETAVKCLGDLYRRALRSSDRFDRNFGDMGLEALKEMEVLSDGQQLFDESKEAIKVYQLAWATLKNTRRGVKKPLRPLVQTLNKHEARPLGLYVVDKYDVGEAAAEDVLTLLRWAVWVGCEELIEDLWNYPRILTTMTNLERSPLFWALEADAQGNKETLEALLDWPGLNPDPIWRDKTLLVVASETGHYQAVDLLLKRGTSTGLSKGLALLLAVKNRHLRVVERLLQAGAPPNLTISPDPNIDGLDGISTTALHWAIGDSAVVELLLDRRANPNSSEYPGGKTPLCLATSAGDVGSIEALLRYGANVEIRDDNGTYPLLIAIDRGYDTIAKLLIGNLPPSEVSQLLGVALQAGQETILDLLLAQGADPNFEKNAEKPPLLMAVEMCQEGIVKKLLLAGANPNVRTADDLRSPLHAAIKSGHRQIISAVLDPAHNADVNLKVEERRTPLALAVELEQADTVKLLLERGANPNAEYMGSQYGAGSCSVLHEAIARGEAEIVKLLLDAGADPEAKDDAGLTPLLLALDMEGTMHNEANEITI